MALKFLSKFLKKLTKFKYCLKMENLIKTLLMIQYMEKIVHKDRFMTKQPFL